jgi:hypothetical protein
VGGILPAHVHSSAIAGSRRRYPVNIGAVQHRCSMVDLAAPLSTFDTGAVVASPPLASALVADALHVWCCVRMVPCGRDARR